MKSCAPETLRRHAFVRLTGDAWQRATAESGDLATLRDWLAAGHPLIVRRPCLSLDQREVFVGLALPDKQRLAYRVPIECVTAIEPPPLYRGECLQSSGLDFRLFGSHAWQELTGRSYVRPSSDLDLLLDISSEAEWHTFLGLNLPLPANPRIDLEIILNGDASFSWREYLNPAETILIKTNQSVGLERKDRLGALLA